MPDRPPEPFRCDVADEGGRVSVRPRGEVDLASVAQLDARLRELRDRGIERLVLDLREVTFMDSNGLRLVLVWDAAFRERGGELTLMPGPPAVQRVFEVTGLLGRLRFDTADER